MPNSIVEIKVFIQLRIIERIAPSQLSAEALRQRDGNQPLNDTLRRFFNSGPSAAIPLRLYRPDDAVGALPVVLYFHGGGFVGGSIDDADAPARAIAERCPALVLAVGYALAPARPFPAAPEDAHCAALWVLANIERFGGDPQRLAVGGDDAGGNLAASLTLIAREPQRSGDRRAGR